AALLACLIGCVVSCLPGRIGTTIGTALGVACASWLMATTTVVAWATQERARMESASSFEKAVDVFDQVRSLSPTFAKGTLVLLLVECGEDSPVGPVGIGVIADYVGH